MLVKLSALLSCNSNKRLNSITSKSCKQIPVLSCNKFKPFLLIFTASMRLSFSYDKKKVLQALRYHFLWQPEIRVLLILIIVFDIVTAILFYTGKIRPEPFLLGSSIWLLFIVSFWFILPANVYKKASTFRDTFIINFGESSVHLENENGFMDWPWEKFTKFVESPNFFHLYFSAKSFFLVPKDNMSDTFRYELRILLNDKIKPAVK